MTPRLLLELLYTVEITTGNKEGSGTDADVFMVLCGKKANSSKFVLKGSSEKNPFQRGGLDVFQLECDDVGDVSDSLMLPYHFFKCCFKTFKNCFKLRIGLRPFTMYLTDILSYSQIFGLISRYPKSRSDIMVQKEI